MKCITLFSTFGLMTIFSVGVGLSYETKELLVKESEDVSQSLESKSGTTGTMMMEPSLSLNNDTHKFLNAVPPVSKMDLQEAIKIVLQQNPELILNILRTNNIELVKVVEQGAIQRKIRKEQDRLQQELEHPKVPEVDVTRPMRGQPDASITIVEYSDFLCPFCGAAYGTVKEILRRYKGEVRFLYKHLPLEFHPLAEPAARYFEAIALQDQESAWQFHDQVLEQQDKLEGKGEEGLKVIVAALSLNNERLEKDLQSTAIHQRIEKDRSEAKIFGFEGTPVFLINGISLKGNQPLRAFEKIIRLFLKANPQDS